MDKHEKLEQWMKEHELSDAELGERLGYHRSYIFRIRTGSRKPSGEFCWRFQKEFGVGAAWRLFRNGGGE